MKQKAAGFTIIIDKIYFKTRKITKDKQCILYDKEANYPRKQNSL